MIPLNFHPPPESVSQKLDLFKEQLIALNKRINLISPETEPHVQERHLLHCLAFTARPFPAGSMVVDWGTGGGLPAIPVAICFPEVSVYAVDAVGKKIQAVRTMGRRLGLTNLHPWHGRAEDWPGKAQYSISRATAPLRDLWRWHCAARTLPNAPVPADAWQPGLLCLKGGVLEAETAALKTAFPDVEVVLHPLHALLGPAFFADKYLVEVHDAFGGRPAQRNARSC